MKRTTLLSAFILQLILFAVCKTWFLSDLSAYVESVYINTIFKTGVNLFGIIFKFLLMVWFLFGSALTMKILYEYQDLSVIAERLTRSLEILLTIGKTKQNDDLTDVDDSLID